MKDVAELRTALLGHYDCHARELPWRRDTDPYRVLVSEIMLQQTRVETVKGYYEPWLERFPSVGELARADEDEVLKAWEGLGYYRRARNLHRAARVVREELGGEIPGGYDELRELPGVGEYTAGAVASIAFGVPVPAVDGNVKRVLARLHDVAQPSPAWLRARAAEMVDPDRPGDWNQALMELGATVCTPRSPQCSSCPWETSCGARAAGTQAKRPAKAPRRPVPTVDLGLAVAHAGGRVLLTKRPYGGLLAGMWAFPEVELEPGSAEGADGGAPGEREILALLDGLGLEPVSRAEALPAVRHRFTHLEASYRPWSVEVTGGAHPRNDSRAWVDPADPGERALPRAQQKVLEGWVRQRTEAS
jgi:A/G-specific adenine glycosylase